MTEPHDHLLDGKLWDDCPMCDEIRRRQRGAAHDAAALLALENHRKRAERSRQGHDDE